MTWTDKINQVWQGDCLELMKEMPDKCVDLVVTDPPYGINVGTSVGGGKPFGKGGRGKFIQPKIYTGFDDRTTPSKKCFEEMIRVSKNQIIFGGNYFIENLTNSSCWLVWDKDNSGNFADCELAWTSFKTAVRKFKWRWNGMLQEVMSDKELRQHPTQKPLPLMKWILQNYSKDNDLIFDPFMGSWTTARACMDLGRNFIGAELSAEYCEIGKNRLKQQVLL